MLGCDAVGGRAGYDWTELAQVLSGVTGVIAGFMFVAFVTLVLQYLFARRRIEYSETDVLEARRVLYLLPGVIVELIDVAIIWAIIAGTPGAGTPGAAAATPLALFGTAPS